ncbi:MAG: GWxTD domain-containing protein [Candidatus Aminicenantes bacterium]|nr:GWxTD domain-containing protein [Candidatus Aminicenantes bacterium]
MALERAEKGKTKEPDILPLFMLMAAFCCHLSCASYQVIKPSLDPQSQKFLDLIRYIATPQEERMFREMPPEDRAEFVVDFWKRRDPNPGTAANEFRDQYYSRLAAADKAFRTGIPGWMTDRGRIFILLGPPTDVIEKSMGEHTTELRKGARELSSDLLEDNARSERPTEIWVYNQYPDYFTGPLRLVFVDYDSTGDYKLTTDVEVKPFSMMSYLQSDPNMVKYQWIGQIESAESLGKILPFLDYRQSLGKVEKHMDEHTVTCSFDIPYGAIDYRKENGAYAYDLELSLEVRHVDLKSSYRNKKEITARLAAEELERNIREALSLTDTFVIPLEKGTNRLYFSVRDNVSQKRLRKLETIRIKG